jgi:hypothetical protein
VIKYRGIAKTAINSVIKTIDNIVNYSYFLLIKWFPLREIIKESNSLNIDL